LNAVRIKTSDKKKQLW